MARNRLYPPSVDPALPVEPRLPSSWKRVTFRDIVQPVERPVKLQDEQLYTLVVAKRSRGGIEFRDELRGREILTKTQFEVHAGDFLISRRQVIHGACGIVPEHLHGAIVSNEYSSLRTTPSVLMDYLKHYSHTSYFQRTCFHSSHGVDVEKMVFKLDSWLNWAFHAPPLSEQRKISTILSSVDDTIEKSQLVIEELQAVKKAMTQELLTRGIPGRHSRFKHTDHGQAPHDWRVSTLGEVLDGIDAGWSPQCEGRPAAAGEWGILKVSAVSWGEFRPEENKKLPDGLEPRPNISVRAGDVLLSRANTPDLVGRTVIVREHYPNLMLSDKLLRLRPAGDLLGEYLNAVMSSAPVRQRMQDGATGSSRSMKNISQEKLKSIVILVPSLDEQRYIADLLDSIDWRMTVEANAVRELRSVKSALLSLLLTGEIRVTPDPEPTP